MLVVTQLGMRLLLPCQCPRNITLVLYEICKPTNRTRAEVDQYMAAMKAHLRWTLRWLRTGSHRSKSSTQQLT